MFGPSKPIRPLFHMEQGAVLAQRGAMRIAPSRRTSSPLK
jgi:hypothetical protein